MITVRTSVGWSCIGLLLLVALWGCEARKKRGARWVCDGESRYVDYQLEAYALCAAH